MGYYGVGFKNEQLSVMREWIAKSRDRVAAGAILVVVLAVVLLPLAFLSIGTGFLSWGVRTFRDEHGLYALIWSDQMLWLVGSGVVGIALSGIVYIKSVGQRIEYPLVILTAACFGAVWVGDWFEAGALVVGGCLALITIRIFRADRLAAFGSAVVAIPLLLFAVATDYPETWYPRCAIAVQEELDALTHSMADDTERWLMYAANEIAANEACDLASGNEPVALRRAARLRVQEFRRIKYALEKRR